MASCLAMLATACDESAESSGETEVASAATVSPSAMAPTPLGFVLPPAPPPVTNPLELPEPTDQPPVEEGQRVFAVPERMLRGARLGTAMKLTAATVVSREGDNLVVTVGFGAPYQIHPAYVVVPRRGRLGNQSYVIATYDGELHHAVVKNLIGDKVNVRFTDLGIKTPDQVIDPAGVGLLGAGPSPGGYAVLLAEHEYSHVLLVSAALVAGKRRWLVLRYTGETELVPEEKLRALPVPRFTPRVGASVLAAWRGTMVRAEVKAIDSPALLSVTRARAGAPILVGPGMVMPTE
jgi:hypothetical protein